MKTAVLAFSGATRSGKSSVSSAVASLLGWQRVSFGAYIRSVAHSRGLPNTREQLQALGESLVSNDLRGFCSAVVGQAPWRLGQSLVIDGVRHAGVVDCLRALVAPTPFYLIHLTVDEATRLSRFRGTVSPSEIAGIDKHSTEIQVATVLPRKADRVVSGDRDLSEVANELVMWLGSL